MEPGAIPLTVRRRASTDSATVSLFSAPSDSGSRSGSRAGELERSLGLWDGMAMVAGAVIGSGIFSTPGLILAAVGSVGMSMVVWVVGAAVSVCGCIAYMELGTMLPRSGGEKEYLDAAFPRPRALLPFLFCMTYIAICGPSGMAADATVTGTYLLYAATGRATGHAEWAQRAIGVAVAALCVVLHGFFVHAAIRIQSALTVVKVLLLLLIVVVGAAKGIGGEHSSTAADVFAGTSTHPSAYVSALFKVFFAYSGYTSLNYSIDELRDPMRNLPRAALGGLLVTAALYVLSNAAYFLVLDPAAVRESGTAVAAVFFSQTLGNAWGHHIVPLLIGLATLGNVMCATFAASRVVFEAAREGYLPLGAALGEISRFRSPLAALGLCGALGCLFIVAPPPGEAYGFLIDIGGYPQWLFSGAAAVGLLVMRRTHAHLPRPFKAWHLANAVTIACAVFMCIVPFVRPDHPDPRAIPHWAAPLAALTFIAASCGAWAMMRYWRGSFK
ncbi:hypothetical protein H4R19_000299 [Coemansia spiralis]|nr:hypothetical protein H4R19_000299 [Coemansia spiralis]